MKPKQPENIVIDGITATSALARWDLVVQTQDQAADAQTVKLHLLPENVLLQEHSLPGDQEQLELSGLLPGMDYQLSVTAVNQDGQATANSSSFTTDSRRK